MKHNRLFAAVAVLTACVAIIICSPICLSISLLGLLTIMIVIISAAGVIWVHIMLSSPHKTGVGVENVQNELETFRNKLMREFDTLQSEKSPQSHLPVIFGRTVDSLLQQLLDYLMRDFIDVYLREYAFESKALSYHVKEDIWGAIQILYDRSQRFDHAKLIACDMVLKINNHFEKIRISNALVAESEHMPLFTLSPHLMSLDQEIHYLQTVSELLIMFLLPRSYSLSPVKHFLKDILACKVLYPFINSITDPDYLNLKVIEYIEAQKITATMHRRTFDHASSFEDFLKMLQKTHDIEELKVIRYDIVTKIMQATTIQNLNRAKGLDPDSERNPNNPSGPNKSEINTAKKLKRYINQLTYAKKECEKRLTNLGWDFGYQFQDETKKLLPLPTILDHILGRKYLSRFLETVASQGLVGYWTAAEELRNAARKNWHQLGAEIFYTFIRNPTAEIKVDKSTRKRMEAFLLGDKGPEVFYEVQQNVVQTLENKYYQPFVISDYYKEMLLAIEKEEDTTDFDTCSASEDRQASTDSGSGDSALNVGDHSNYARRKLNQLQEKLDNKTQALQALKSSLKPDSRILKILENEVEWLQGEQRQLEAHLTRTETWGENLGKWRALVQSADIPDEKEPPQFVIVVHMLEVDAVEGDEAVSTGWVVSRTLPQFQDLHRKLRPLCSDVRSLELPSQTFKFLFGKSDKNSLEKAKSQIQKYLDFILEDDRLNQSEAIYSFLSPSSEHLKHSSPSPKKTRFSFSTFFKSEQSSKDSISVFRESEEEDISQCLDAPGTGDTVDGTKFTNGNFSRALDDSKDTIAEPLYSLMSEIFDMRGLFKYLRKTLIAFVQVTYGRTINRQIYDTIAWCFSEQMLHYYVSLVIKNWWPGGRLAETNPERSLGERLETRKQARELFVANVPDVLVMLVGAKSARTGAMKVFDTLQNKLTNKQLFYDLFELTLSEMYPELNMNVN